MRLRQAVLVARDLEATVAELTSGLALGEPFHDEGVSLFGLRNAVFALGDTFLEVVSPVQPDTSAGRLLDRRRVDAGGYMVMFQVDDVPAVRRRAREAGVRAVWEITLDDMDEVHLHPRDMAGAIVAASRPEPPAAWRWGGPGWPERAAAGALAGATIAVGDPAASLERWSQVLGAPPPVDFAMDADEPGLVAVRVEAQALRDGAFEAGGVRFLPA